MTTKIVLPKPVPKRSVVPSLPAALALPAQFVTNSKHDTRPSVVTRAELIARVGVGESITVSGVPSTKDSQVVAIVNSFGAIIANVEVVEGIVAQVL